MLQKIYRKINIILYKIQWHFFTPVSDHFFSRLYKKQIEDINCVCLFMGPYRNLTTLTASMLSLHPNCRVLNHGGMRVFGRKKVDFLKNPVQAVMNEFLQFALYASSCGKRGSFGGGINKSHAFNEPLLKQKYIERKIKSRKKNLTCLVWKESHKLSNHIKIEKINIDDILNFDQEIKFVLPIRNPIHCVLSNIKNNYAKHFGLDGINPVLVLDKLFDEYLYFLKLQKKYPDNFFHIFENAFITQLPQLESFLILPNSPEWKKDVAELFVIKQKEKPDDKLIDSCRNLIEKKFQEFPEFKIKLSNLSLNQYV